MDNKSTSAYLTAYIMLYKHRLMYSVRRRESEALFAFFIVLPAEESKVTLFDAAFRGLYLCLLVSNPARGKEP